MLNAKNLENGHEQHEFFKMRISRQRLVQYDYRHTDGELFSCVKSTIEACKQARNIWLNKKING